MCLFRLAPQCFTASHFNSDLFFVRRWLYWVDNSTIFRGELDGSNPIIFITGSSEPLELTIDFVSEMLYWSDSSGMVWESSLALNSLSKRQLFHDTAFMPFKLEIVRNFVIATSQVNNSYVLVDREDLSVAFVPTNALYYGVSVVSELKKPSFGKLTKI